MIQKLMDSETIVIRTEDRHDQQYEVRRPVRPGVKMFSSGCAAVLVPDGESHVADVIVPAKQAPAGPRAGLPDHDERPAARSGPDEMEPMLATPTAVPAWS